MNKEADFALRIVLLILAASYVLFPIIAIGVYLLVEPAEPWWKWVIRAELGAFVFTLLGLFSVLMIKATD